MTYTGLLCNSGRDVLGITVFRRKECNLEMSINRTRTSLDVSMKRASEATCVSKEQWFSVF